jgi:bacillithiol biosynthesis deacetylase BshB1
MQATDALFLAPHPDDVEIAAGGTVLRLRARGLAVALVDVTRGEKGSRGTVDDRAREAAAAAKALDVGQRVNLGLPDTGVRVDDQNVRRVVELLRTARPRLFFAPAERDVHPDHVAVGELAGRAFFLAGLVNFAPELGAPHRPRLFARYPGNVPVEPTFAVDISDVVAGKAAAIRCYATQLQPGDRSHLIQGLDVLERAQARDRFYGARIGVAAAEPFVVDGPLPIRDVALLG